MSPGFWQWTEETVSVFVSRQQIFPELDPGLPLSFLSWAYILQGSIFGRTVRQAC